jgi:pyrroline-5-carboxylate reductase
MEKIGFIGSGNMAEALIKGMIGGGTFKASDIYVSDVRAERLDFLADEYGVRKAAGNKELASEVDILILSIKPQKMAEALESIKGAVKKGALVISIVAGVRVGKIAAALGDRPIVRVMPNTPALIGEGASVLFANEKAKPRVSEALAIFSAVGKAIVVGDEGLIDAATAVSGSGPAYYFLLMEEMIKAGCELGLPEQVAKELVLQTAKGAALLAAERDEAGESPVELRRKVTSPGGTTEAAMKVFAEGNFSALIRAGIKRARDRSAELSGL